MVSKTHQEFLTRQAAVHKTFLDHRQNVLTIMGSLTGQGISSSANEKATQAVDTVPVRKAFANNSHIKPVDQKASSQTSGHRSAPMGPVTMVAPVTKKASPVPSSQHHEPDAPVGPVKDQFANAAYIEPTGPKFSKEQLEILASGKISDVFGEMFKIQDDFSRQVRLPEYPLLLADRITGLKAEPGSMGKGIIWTETDVKADAWYINDIYMPAGVTVESGQCDLTLVSYLGADFKNKGKRVYRLLGCDLIYYGEPPRVGDTLCYQIHVDGHANIGETRIFFFRYDC